jgi:hypothetical protein
VKIDLLSSGKPIGTAGLDCNTEQTAVPIAVHMIAISRRRRNRRRG